MIRALALLLCIATPASAEIKCTSHDAIVTGLGVRFKETRLLVALGQNGVVIEFFLNAETQTWTLVATQPDGPSCLLAAGAGFAYVDEPLPPEGEPG